MLRALLAAVLAKWLLALWQVSMAHVTGVAHQLKVEHAAAAPTGPIGATAAAATAANFPLLLISALPVAV